MKIPKRPPSEATWIQQLTDEQAVSKILAVRQPTVNGEYIHWDKLRHLGPPLGLNHEQWWAALKLCRGSGHTVPLADHRGQPFKYVVFDAISEQLHRIDQDAGGSLVTSDPMLSPDQRDRYIVRSLVEEAITSSQIEGAATTRKVAKQMIRSGRPPRDRGEQMILNNYMAMRHIRKIRREDALSIREICDLHRILTDKTLDHADEAGRFRARDEPVRVDDQYNEVLHEPPPAAELDDRMQAMCDFANNQTPGYFVHPVIRSVILHFWLAYVHPFTDGNGRCARALFYWSMLRHGYWMCEFISISDIIRKAYAQYGTAFLHTETDDNDLTYFLIYHLDLIGRAIKQVQNYARRKNVEMQAVEKMMRTSVGLNYRQQAVLSHALRHPNAGYTIQSHQTSHDVVYDTARVDLLDLADRGLLEKHKVGRLWHFRPAEGLEERLRRL